MATVRPGRVLNHHVYLNKLHKRHSSRQDGPYVNKQTASFITSQKGQVEVSQAESENGRTLNASDMRSFKPSPWILAKPEVLLHEKQRPRTTLEASPFKRPDDAHSQSIRVEPSKVFFKQPRMAQLVAGDSPRQSDLQPGQFPTELTHMNTSIISAAKPECCSVIKNQINFKFDHFRMNQRKRKKHSKRAKSGNFKNLNQFANHFHNARRLPAGRDQATAAQNGGHPAQAGRSQIINIKTGEQAES